MTLQQVPVVFASAACPENTKSGRCLPSSNTTLGCQCTCYGRQWQQRRRRQCAKSVLQHVDLQLGVLARDLARSPKSFHLQVTYFELQQSLQHRPCKYTLRLMINACLTQEFCTQPTNPKAMDQSSSVCFQDSSAVTVCQPGTQAGPHRTAQQMPPGCKTLGLNMRLS
jgi:hypothetical protein